MFTDAMRAAISIAVIY